MQKLPKFRVNHLTVKMDCRRYFSEHREMFRGDAPMQREYWLTYTDELCRAGLISQHQRDTWSCPF